MAALLAAQCAAEGQHTSSPVKWSFDGEQAFYRNPSNEPVVIVPMHKRLEPGQTLAVTWERGETSYSMRHAV